ncbi:hypothetical protein LS70_003445 [Helicobacter sp. MIT 11-5569]|uniref:hypothetical protein n=1 Tax=Helicobacter sp. MIT 11-5569 TaxID=1548151 RepID=UPI00051FD827|nr:hypothetical protein [Helicobacter sp. MIT 11-5569]TLD83875.1 hypothetical protein LS70_003445 [Helicobacter sp. MIT 11-5569]
MCAVFEFGLCGAGEVNLPKNAKIGKTLEGKKLQEMLQKVKDSKKAVADKNKIQMRTILPVDNFTFNPDTDILVEVTDSSGSQVLYYLAAKKDKQAFCFDVKGTENAPVEWVEPKVGTEEWKAIENAYNGTFKADNTGGPRVATNSVGMWIYATSYKDFANAIIFSRNYSGNGPIRTDYFHAVINADGTLQITSALTDYSVDRVYTTKPYPLNEWVYIQAFQQANLYTIGWKTATDEEQKSKTFTRETDLVGKDLNNIFTGLTGATKTCVPIREFFYQPGIYMFELMNNYNAKAKIMEQAIQNVFGLDTELVDNINATIMEQESYLSLDNFDVYIDDNGVIYVVDIRNTSIGL